MHHRVLLIGSATYGIYEYYVGNKKIEEAITKQFCPYKEGEEVEVYYNPNNYSEFYIVGEKSNENVGKSSTVVGIISLIIGIFVAIFLLI